MTYPVEKTDAEWRALLAAKDAEPMAYFVTRQAATERPHTGKYDQVWADGSYHCSTTPSRHSTRSNPTRPCSRLPCSDA